jgi:hypothetical protein
MLPLSLLAFGTAHRRMHFSCALFWRCLSANSPKIAASCEIWAEAVQFNCSPSLPGIVTSPQGGRKEQRTLSIGRRDAERPVKGTSTRRPAGSDPLRTRSVRPPSDIRRTVGAARPAKRRPVSQAYDADQLSLPKNLRFTQPRAPLYWTLHQSSVQSPVICIPRPFAGIVPRIED